MVIAYHKGTIVYAYKGVIDHDWTGGVLVDFKKIFDLCTNKERLNQQPAPSAQQNNPALLGLAFDETSPHTSNVNCDTIYGNFNSPIDCCWYDCFAPATGKRGTQQTVTIYVH